MTWLYAGELPSWWISARPTPDQTEAAALRTAIRLLRDLNRRMKMASARLETMRQEIAAAQQVLRDSVPILKNYSHLKATADELDEMDALIADLAKDRAVAGAALQMATAAPTELPDVSSKTK